MVDSHGHRIQSGLINQKKLKALIYPTTISNKIQYQFPDDDKSKAICQTMQKDIEKNYKVTNECEHVFYVPGIVHSVGKSNY